ncbi:hypothetical protein GGR27_002557 [Lewinella antarctica]|uniref:Uncharacterized protein n=1 Tax=Neolewinella antarctica TaxID=442734 RepID=A0ABX0XDS1_9BACT|nr:hypothetical protein [Neolewinella antarctica]
MMSWTLPYARKKAGDSGGPEVVELIIPTVHQ